MCELDQCFADYSQLVTFFIRFSKDQSALWIHPREANFGL